MKLIEVNFVPKDVVTIESKRWLEKNSSSQKTKSKKIFKEVAADISPGNNGKEIIWLKVKSGELVWKFSSFATRQR